MGVEMISDGRLYFAETMSAFTDRCLNNSAIIDAIHSELVMLIG
ncbi:hypothetical protein PEC301877_24750 [Pectobacterium carotovorum subsp. carotovorum]|nr:hypothetical protein PEC301877_24750 [Pectobacterium carotovorum subsp. carotovorum]